MPVEPLRPLLRKRLRPLSSKFWVAHTTCFFDVWDLESSLSVVRCCTRETVPVVWLGQVADALETSTTDNTNRPQVGN